jgi:hypothetical protein
VLLATADAVPVAPTPVEARAAADVERRMGPRAGAHVEFARLRERQLLDETGRDWGALVPRGRVRRLPVVARGGAGAGRRGGLLQRERG